MFPIEIPKRASTCCLQGEPLHPGMEYYSVLLTKTDEVQKIERRDYCSRCWVQRASAGAHTALSSWKSIVPERKGPSTLPQQKEARAFFLLKECLASISDEKEEEAFVLALFLARRRRLVLRQEIVSEMGKRLSLYEDRETEDMLCVPQRTLSNLQVDKIQAQLATKFHGCGN